MYFIDKKSNKQPDILEEFKKNNTKEWIDYYSKKISSKPKDYWNHEDIKKSLFELFKESCGYCGFRTKRKDNPENNNFRGKIIYTGQIDHYIPKSKKPELVYDWDNLNWCCKDCNSIAGGKGRDCDELCMILNPSNKDDVEYLEFDKGTGEYNLKNKYKKDKNICDRYELTCKNTWINEEDITKLRKYMYEKIIEILNDLKGFYKNQQSIAIKMIIQKREAELKKEIDTCCFKSLALHIISDFNKDNDLNITFL